MKRIISLLLVFCMALSLAACGGGGANNGTQGGGTTHTGDGLSIAACIAEEPETMDPGLNSSSDAGTYFQHLFEGLTKFQVQPDGSEPKIVPGQAAEMPVISEDGLTYTFTLRDDIYWSDGQPVTAHDFVYAWQRLVDPATASPYGTFLNMVENAKQIQEGEADKSQLGVVAEDDKTLVVTLVAPTAFFVEVLNFGSLMPLREDVVEGNDQWSRDPATYITNGKYTLVEWRHGQDIVMQRNPDYYDQSEITVERITWKLMADANAIFADFNAGNLDFTNIFPVDELTHLIQTGTVNVVPKLGTYAVVFNTEHPAFTDPRVRQAFSLAIDRNFIVNNVTQAEEAPAAAWVPYGTLGLEGHDFRVLGGDYYSVDPADYEANTEKARQLMADAGYPGGVGFPQTTYLYNTMASHQRIYEALENMWTTELGVRVGGQNQDWNVFLQSRAVGDFDLGRHGWIADFNDPISFLDQWETAQIGSNNYARWSNAEYDQLIHDSIMELDPAKRQQLLHEAEDLMMKEAIVAPLYFYTESYALNSRLQGVSHTVVGKWLLWGVTEK